MGGLNFLRLLLGSGLCIEYCPPMTPPDANLLLPHRWKKNKWFMASARKLQVLGLQVGPTKLAWSGRPARLLQVAAKMRITLLLQKVTTTCCWKLGLTTTLGWPDLWHSAPPRSPLPPSAGTGHDRSLKACPGSGLGLMQMADGCTLLIRPIFNFS